MKVAYYHMKHETNNHYTSAFADVATTREIISTCAANGAVLDAIHNLTTNKVTLYSKTLTISDVYANPYEGEAPEEETEEQPQPKRAHNAPKFHNLKVAQIVPLFNIFDTVTIHEIPTSAPIEGELITATFDAVNLYAFLSKNPDANMYVHAISATEEKDGTLHIYLDVAKTKARKYF